MKLRLTTPTSAFDMIEVIDEFRSDYRYYFTNKGFKLI